jgi:hypothetical protein
VSVRESKELIHIKLSDSDRTGHLPKLVEDLVARLDQSNGPPTWNTTVPSVAAAAHGRLRFLQGYTPSMMVRESRILQVTLFGTLQENLKAINFSLLLPDVMTIADEVDAQLTQSMDGFMESMNKPVAA